MIVYEIYFCYLLDISKKVLDNSIVTTMEGGFESWMSWEHKEEPTG